MKFIFSFLTIFTLLVPVAYAQEFTVFSNNDMTSQRTLPVTFEFMCWNDFPITQLDFYAYLNPNSQLDVSIASQKVYEVSSTTVPYSEYTITFFSIDDLDVPCVNGETVEIDFNNIFGGGNIRTTSPNIANYESYGTGYPNYNLRSVVHYSGSMLAGNVYQTVPPLETPPEPPEVLTSNLFFYSFVIYLSTFFGFIYYFKRRKQN